MDAVRPGHTVQSTPEERVARGFSANYRGNIDIEKNRAANIDPAYNCSLFLTNLPAGTNEKILLDAITLQAPFGRVMVTSVQHPRPEEGKVNAAGKITFATRKEAENLFQFVWNGKLVIGGMTIHVSWDRNMVAPTTHAPHVTRVLEITGRKDHVNVHWLDSFFRSKCAFHTQEVYITAEKGDERTIEWLFGSVRGQAEAARMALEKDGKYRSVLHVRYGIDPITQHIKDRMPLQNVADTRYTPTVVTPALAAQAGQSQYHDGRGTSSGW